MDLMETDTTHEGSQLADDLSAALIENEILQAQVHDLEAINEQIRDRLRDLKDLVGTVKSFADDILADSSE